MTDQIAYMDAAAATAVGLDYKRRFLDALEVRPGQTVVDLGCGPGTDLARHADAVGARARSSGSIRSPDAGRGAPSSVRSTERRDPRR